MLKNWGCSIFLALLNFSRQKVHTVASLSFSGYIDFYIKLHPPTLYTSILSKQIF